MPEGTASSQAWLPRWQMRESDDVHIGASLTYHREKLAPLAATLTQLVDALSKLPNLLAIVLVGSHATGPARSNSDLDIGLYFRQSRPFSIDQVRICGGELRGGRSDARGNRLLRMGTVGEWRRSGHDTNGPSRFPLSTHRPVANRHR